jgi:hypothetical protein
LLLPLATPSAPNRLLLLQPANLTGTHIPTLAPHILQNTAFADLFSESSEQAFSRFIRPRLYASHPFSPPLNHQHNQFQTTQNSVALFSIREHRRTELDLSQKDDYFRVTLSNS